VIEETTKKKLPEGFQTSEFQLENGFLDFIVDRKQLKEKLGVVLGLMEK
jgi:acetyl-CoA carboxylase carboxyl transferase subunit beta